MRTPCPKCGAHAVWTRVADVKRARSALVFVFECTLCSHTYREEHAVPQLKIRICQQAGPSSQASLASIYDEAQ